MGAVSDSFGRFNSVIMTQIFSTAIVFGLFFNVHHTTWMFYVFCAAWGFMYGAILSMMNVLIREWVSLFPPKFLLPRNAD